MRVKTKLISLLLVLSSFIPPTSVAQVNFISGTISNAITGKAIPFANIYFDQFSGTVSDMDGNYALSIKSTDQNAVIQISCIGYETKIVPINTIKQKENNFKLKPTSYHLSNFTVTDKPLTASEILSLAIKRIPENYVIDRKIYKANFREKQTIWNTTDGLKTRTLTSALLINDPGYKKQYNGSSVKEDIYIVGITQPIDSLDYYKYPYNKRFSEAKWLMLYNDIRYKPNFHKSRKFNYTIVDTLYDSIRSSFIWHINVRWKKTKSFDSYFDIYVNSDNFQIERISYFSKSKKSHTYSFSDETYYFNAHPFTCDLLFSYNESGQLQLSYISYSNNHNSYLVKDDSPNLVMTWFAEIRIVGEYKGTSEDITKYPKMKNNVDMGLQEVINDKGFWEEYNIDVEK